MISKPIERERAIALRREGMSLRDIVKIVPVAKSTLSLWLKQVSLSRPQKQRLTQKRLDAALRGAARRKSDRIALTQKIFEDAAKDVVSISKRELWLMGVMLYWAEGAKQKDHSPSTCLKFSNSDPVMLRLFVRWLEENFGVQSDILRFDVYIHESIKRTREELFEYWAIKIGVPLFSFKSVYLKKGNIKTKRKNIGEAYFGLVRLTVPRSTIFNRKISGWVKGVEKYYWGIV